MYTCIMWGEGREGGRGEGKREVYTQRREGRLGEAREVERVIFYSLGSAQSKAFCIT